MYFLLSQRQLRSDFNRLDHAFGVCSAFSGLSKGRPVIDRYPDNGKSAGDIDPLHRTPGFCFVVVLEADQFRWNMALVMVHDDDKIILSTLHL